MCQTVHLVPVATVPRHQSDLCAARPVRSSDFYSVRDSIEIPSTIRQLAPHGRRRQWIQTQPNERHRDLDWAFHSSHSTRRGEHSDHPQWSDRASPATFAGFKPLMPLGVALEQLPAIDLVLLSHDRYDHLDVETVRGLARLYQPPLSSPAGRTGRSIPPPWWDGPKPNPARPYTADRPAWRPGSPP